MNAQCQTAFFQRQTPHCLPPFNSYKITKNGGVLIGDLSTIVYK